MARWLSTERDGTKLSCLDFGGEGPDVVLLHGLAGHAGEWAETAAWLSDRARVVAHELRGHGRSERFPTDVSPDAHVADAAFVIEQYGLEPAVLVGQSLGGRAALLLAAEQPQLVGALVLADAGPAEGGERTLAEVEHWLSSWPVPFGSRQAAVEFFGGPSLSAEMWVDGLEEQAEGFRPRFDVDVMIRTLGEASGPCWSQWERITCPTLIVQAGRGAVSASEAQEMSARLAHAQLREIPGAEHDLHLSNPAEWRRALSGFLDSLDV